jgi:hypothetical protein
MYTAEQQTWVFGQEGLRGCREGDQAAESKNILKNRNGLILGFSGDGQRGEAASIYLFKILPVKNMGQRQERQEDFIFVEGYVL